MGNGSRRKESQNRFREKRFMRRNERKMHRSRAKRVVQPRATDDNGQSKMHLQNVSHPQTERSLSRLTNDSKLLCHSIKNGHRALSREKNLRLKTRILICRHARLSQKRSIFLIKRLTNELKFQLNSFEYAK